MSASIQVTWDDLWSIYRTANEEGKAQIREQLDLPNLLVGLSYRNRKMVMLEAPLYIQKIMEAHLKLKMSEVNNGIG